MFCTYILTQRIWLLCKGTELLEISLGEWNIFCKLWWPMTANLDLKKKESELQNKTKYQFQNKRESHFQNKTKSQF